jgi:hypothetical protein
VVSRRQPKPPRVVQTKHTVTSIWWTCRADRASATRWRRAPPPIAAGVRTATSACWIPVPLRDGSLLLGSMCAPHQRSAKGKLQFLGQVREKDPRGCGHCLLNTVPSPSAREVMRSTTAVRPSRDVREARRNRRRCWSDGPCRLMKGGGAADLIADQRWIQLVEPRSKNQRFRWLEAIWWAWEDLNQRPHPERRIPRHAARGWRVTW